MAFLASGPLAVRQGAGPASARRARGRTGPSAASGAGFTRRLHRRNAGCYNPVVKTLFRWLFRLATGLALVIVVLALSRDFLLRQFLQWRLEAATGLEARIGYCHLSLSQPTVRVEGLKLYCPAQFGGVTFAEVPEVYGEYDRDALLGRRIHFRRVRLNLATLNVVADATGQTSLEWLRARQKPGGAGETTYDWGRWPLALVSFQGIDRLDLTLGRVAFSSLKNPGMHREVNLGVRGVELRNVRSMADLNGFVLGLVLRHGLDFLGLTPSAAPQLEAAPR